MAYNVVLINPHDNVGVALTDIGKGGEAKLSNGLAFAALEDIPYSHKVSLREIPAGEPIVKYGEEIGHARARIPQGSWVHTHNLVIGEEA